MRETLSLCASLNQTNVALLEVEKIGKVYMNDALSTVALKNITFTIDSGAFIAFMGPSGSGKSTLLHILGFLDRPTSGHYRFDGHDMNLLTDDQLAHIRNQKIGFVFQAFNLLARATVIENIMLPLQYSPRPRQERLAKAIAAAAKVGLNHRLQHTTSQLSGGEKQRVAIARALVNEPRLIFADEPTGNLDSKNGELIMQQLSQLNKEQHTIVLITHEMSAAKFAKRIIHLRDGTIVADETTAEHVIKHYQK